MAGISLKAAGKLENKIKYNNMELQSDEYADGSGLEMYEYKYRFYNHQIGRVISQDALACKYPHYAPYQFAGNQVPNAIDLDGLEELRVNDMPNGQRLLTVHKIDAPFSIDYNGTKLDNLPQQNMRDYYRNNVVVKYNTDRTGGVSDIKLVDDNSGIQTFQNNDVEKKEPLLDQIKIPFDAQPVLGTLPVSSIGTEGFAVMQSSNVENANTTPNQPVSLPASFTNYAFDYSSMSNTDTKTFTVNVTQGGANVYSNTFTGTTGTNNPAIISLPPIAPGAAGYIMNVGVTQPATNTNANYNYQIRTLDTTKPGVKNL